MSKTYKPKITPITVETDVAEFWTKESWDDFMDDVDAPFKPNAYLVEGVPMVGERVEFAGRTATVEGMFPCVDTDNGWERVDEIRPAPDPYGKEDALRDARFEVIWDATPEDANEVIERLRAWIEAQGGE